MYFCGGREGGGERLLGQTMFPINICGFYSFMQFSFEWRIPSFWGAPGTDIRRPMLFLWSAAIRGCILHGRYAKLIRSMQRVPNLQTVCSPLLGITSANRISLSVGNAASTHPFPNAESNISHIINYSKLLLTRWVRQHSNWPLSANE